MTELQIYVACLASYNNGVLHGEWIDVAEIVEAVVDGDNAIPIIWNRINKILRESRFPNVQRQDCRCPACDHEWTRTLHDDPAQDKPPIACRECGEPVEYGAPYPSAEEWAIHDYSGAWPSGFGENPSIESVVEWANLIREADERGIPAPVVKAVASHFGDPDGPRGFELTRHAIEDDFSGVHRSLAEWAEELESECGSLASVPERLRPYIDFEAIGRDARLGGDVLDIEHDGQVYVFWNR